MFNLKSYYSAIKSSKTVVKSVIFKDEYLCRTIGKSRRSSDTINRFFIKHQIYFSL